MDLHKRLPAMSLEHHKPLKLCQRSERITSSPSLLSWPSSLSLPSWLSSQVPLPQQPSSSTSLLSLLSLPSSPSWPSLPSSPSSPSWEPFWEVGTVESGSEEFWRGLGHENKKDVTSVEMWRLRCDLNDFVSGGWKLLLAMEKVWCRFRHAPSPVLPLREPKPIHSDSATQQSVHSSCQVFAVFLQLLVINLKWLASFIRAISTLKNHFVIFCVSSGSICGIVWYSFLLFWYSIWHSIWHSILAFYSASILTSYLASILASILKFLWHSFWHSIWHLFWHSFWHLFWHSIWHSFLAFYLASILTFSLACVEVRHCPLRCGAWGSGQAVPTQIWNSRLTSSSAHPWNLELPVEVRQCPLRSGARGSGLAVDSAIWSSRLRSNSAHWNLELAAGR